LPPPTIDIGRRNLPEVVETGNGMAAPSRTTCGWSIDAASPRQDEYTEERYRMKKRPPKHPVATIMTVVFGIHPYYYFFKPSVSMFSREFKNWKYKMQVQYYYY